MLIIKFLITNLIGFFSVTALTLYADSADLIPSLPPELVPTFQRFFFGGTMGAWVFGALLSALAFFVKGFLRILLLLLPIIIPFVFGSGVLIYFN